MPTKTKSNPPFNGSETALRRSAVLQNEASPQVANEAQENFRKDDDVRWQPSGARPPERSGDSPACFSSKRRGQIAKGNPQGERGGVYQFGVPPKGNANFAWVQHFIHYLAPQGMAGFVLANPTSSPHCCQMKIVEDVRKYPAERGIAEEDALKEGMEAKSKDLAEKGAEIYAKASHRCRS